MACPEFITKGRKVCSTTVGGVKNISFMEYKEGLLSVTGIINSTLLTGADIFKYEVAKNESVILEDTYTKDIKATGTGFSAGTLNADLQVLDKATADELKLLVQSNLFIFIELHNGDTLLAGGESGADLISIVTKSGGKKGDFSGFSVSFSWEERLSPIWLDSAAITAYKAAISDEFITV
ncbi:hypothetical protein NJT12_04980 [Flavobacterium sp. AC]|uniref:Uncharacterized protein n=1 Tax=Flavobacterium azizsancarii TaxID=2961580 RepID=A0ABT4W8U1_9FLAO|nr:hypothetical protein [Flavobacterium azizsancarii]MDA6068971.1 hypothetical protein [Flavobacterium azizsancarii]